MAEPGKKPFGAQIAEIMPDARATAMGETFCAIADDVHSLYYNPAGLGLIGWTEIPVAGNELFGGVDYQHFGLAYSLRDVRAANLDDLGTIAAGYTEMTSGDIDRRDAAGLRHGTFMTKDQMLVFGYGRTLYDSEETGRILGGATLKTISEEIAGHTFKNNAFDAGALWQFPSSGMSLGLAVQNLGGDLSYRDEAFKQPTNIKAGAAYRDDDVLVGLDINSPAHADPYYCLGGEYRFLRALALRAGYNTRSDQGGFSVGFGVNLRQLDVLFMYARDIEIDYAFVPMGDLGDTHRIAMIFKLGAD
jgi:hypothetical protein